jgi:predicted Zn-dependent protease with MMP-like domain
MEKMTPTQNEWNGRGERWGRFSASLRNRVMMTREAFNSVVEEALDSLPKEFRSRIRNVAVLVEDLPPHPLPQEPGQPRKLLLGIFHGVPTTQKSVFDLPTGPDYVLLYQKNIEAACSTDDEIRRQVRQSVIHEFGHYFGMSEEQLKDV